MLRHSLLLTLCLLMPAIVPGQEWNEARVRSLITSFKEDPRGPYKEIRWFCKDGTTRPARDPCPQPGGVQHAVYKDQVAELGRQRHIYLGQILTGTEKAAFWDEEWQHSRLKQYQLETYLASVDNGWIHRKAQFYRGAKQSEDEEQWGYAFLLWLLDQEDVIRNHYFLTRQAVHDLPHGGENDAGQEVRSLSRVIAESYSPFMELRTKIHNNPQAADIVLVREFKKAHASELSAAEVQKTDLLISHMQQMFQPVSRESVERLLRRIPEQHHIHQRIGAFVADHLSHPLNASALMAGCDLLMEVRDAVVSDVSPAARLALLDFSIALERTIFNEAENWETETVLDLSNKICHLAVASAGAGYLQSWEWYRVSEEITFLSSGAARLDGLEVYFHGARKIVEWGSSLINAVYGDVVALYSGFEPRANGFVDDRIRSTLLLPLGNAVTEFGKFFAKEGGLKNAVMKMPNANLIRGLNPGFAKGELVVLDQAGDDFPFAPDKIYIIDRPPADMKPVAGIATVREGNLVSHIQLLARNLAIPNAVIAPENLEDLKRYSGREVFYAVSEKGTVIMKEASDMTGEEKALFETRKREEDKVRVPVDKIDLTRRSVIDMRSIGADASGSVCGPKAANLGELKKMFPAHVVEGIVIPFGIFREHMNQPMPGHDMSYWEYVNATFTDIPGELGPAGVDQYVLDRLAVLREAITAMPLMPDFRTDLETTFHKVLGSPLGELPVFLRSDTNMEDLKDFTGAGLNLTIFNVVDRDRILQGIKEVWASPFTERSYTWRQKYLLNPENVYPSILIIPSVNVDCSGVLITQGMTSGDPDDLTVAFSRGVGGAVEGQAAESYQLRKNGYNEMLTPSREVRYRIIPPTGGTVVRFADFGSPVLSLWHLSQLRKLSAEISGKMSEGTHMGGPYDIELGFKDGHIWLFQMRPFVENRNAQASGYLQSINPDFDKDRIIALSRKL